MNGQNLGRWVEAGVHVAPLHPVRIPDEGTPAQPIAGRMMLTTDGVLERSVEEVPVRLAPLRGRASEQKVRVGRVDDGVRNPERVVAMARPGPVTRPSNEAGLHRVSILVAHDPQHVGSRGLDARRSQPLHNDLAAAPKSAVHPARKAVVHDLPERGELLLAQRRRAKHVRVSAHQAVRVNEDAVLGLVAAEELEELFARPLLVEEALVVVGLPAAVIDGLELYEHGSRNATHARGGSKLRTDRRAGELGGPPTHAGRPSNPRAVPQTSVPVAPPESIRRPARPHRCPAPGRFSRTRSASIA